MSENDGGILGDGTPIAMGVVSIRKRQSQIDHLEIGEGSIVTLESGAQHYVTVASSVSQDLHLSNVLVTNSRSGHGNNVASLHHNVASSNHDTYGTLEYVTSPVVTLEDDHQNKFNDGLVPVSNVDFVEMNDTNMKGGSGPPLEIYFDVMPTTSANTTQVPQATASYLPRHEHQTPKAQLLVRAYSDFIQPQEQQQQQQALQQQSHQQQSHQQQINVQVHHSDQNQSSEHPVSILPEVLEANFVQLEQAVIPHSLNEYRKTNKLDSQKRHIQIHMPQQKQIHNFVHDSLEHDSIHNQKLIIEQQTMHHQQQSMHSQQSHEQLQLQDHMKQQSSYHQSSQQQQQQQPRYQLIHKQFSDDVRQLNLPQYVIKDEMLHDNIMTHYSNHHSKNMEDNSVVVTNKQSLVNDISKHHGTKMQNDQQFTTQHMPLVSRSGRPIRRRPEYVEYVNQNMKEEQMLQNNRNIPMIKVESNSTCIFDDNEVEELVYEEQDINNSNDEDQDPSGTYSSDGKKSLPHKKRIPKKLKNTKKQVKCYKCIQCGDQFITQNQLNIHKQTHTPSPAKPKQFICEICSKGFDSQLKFFEHLKTHYEPFKKHKCEVCGGEFGNAQLLQEHSLVHSREHFKCNVCHKTFRKESMLEVHIKVAHLEEDENNSIENLYTCAACPKSFKSQIALDTHVQSDHVDNPPEFNCEDCYRGFKSKAKLLQHRKVEHKEEVNHGKGAPKKKLKLGKSLKGGYACTLCPRTFTHKNSLIYHIRGHTGERPHQCEQCGKAFYAASALKVHLRLHSGEKPYKCESCGKFFRQWGDLRYHTSSVHSDERQFQCEFCGKDFKRKYCLVVHRRIHTGEKKYKCEYCQKSFRASSYLQNHKRIHTGERPYPCPDCGKPFRVRSDMKRHRHTHMREGGLIGPSTQTGIITNVAGGNSNSGNHNSSHSSSPTPQPSTIITRQGNHHQGQVQILQGSVTSGQLGQLIIAEGVPTVIGEQNQPIRIMVSGLPTQNVQPPPAHRHSQVTTVSMSNAITSMTPGSPSTASNSTTNTNNSMTPEVIIMDESNSQPINLNILPRIIAQGSSSGSHPSVVGEEEYQLIPASRAALEMREEGDVCVWSGVHVFTS